MTASRLEPGAPRRVVEHDCIDSDHPCLPGHFPGLPVVPAVVLLARVARVVRGALPGVEISRLVSAKFPAPLLPDTPFEIRIDWRGEAQLAFSCMAGETQVAHGSLVVGTGTAAG